MHNMVKLTKYSRISIKDKLLNEEKIKNMKEQRINNQQMISYQGSRMTNSVINACTFDYMNLFAINHDVMMSGMSG